MRNDRGPRLLPLFFTLLILAMGLFLLFLPRQAFSPLEKRRLADPPAFSLEGGQFSRDIEAFLGDHFPLRARWVGLNARLRQYTGLMVADEVWRLPDGALVQAPLMPDWARLELNLALLADFSEAAGLPLVLLCPPEAGAVSGQQGYYPYPDQDILARLKASLPAGHKAVPLFDAFSASQTPLYYRTDPHWNGQGAFAAYRLCAPYLGLEPLPASAFTVRKSPGFYGSAYARSGLWALPSDTLEMWDSRSALSLRFGDSDKTYDSLFFTDHLSAPDQYPVFLDGNHGLTDIINLDNPGGPKLMMLKDSFGNALAPLLLPHFSRITVLDLRACRESPLALAREMGYDQLLAVYSLRFLATDTNFAWLGQP